MMYLTAILLVFAAFLGLAMELYKKTLRKDKAGELEIKGVALCCSALLGFVTFRILAGTGLDGGLNPNGYLTVLYTITIYLLQLPACMAFWKPLLKRFMERKTDG
jgi:hypothetical protein